MDKKINMWPLDFKIKRHQIEPGVQSLEITFDDLTNEQADELAPQVLDFLKDLPGRRNYEYDASNIDL